MLLGKGLERGLRRGRRGGWRTVLAWTGPVLGSSGTLCGKPHECILEISCLGLSAEMCRGFLLYRICRALPDIFLEDLPGHFCDKHEEMKGRGQIHEESRRLKDKNLWRIRSPNARQKRKELIAPGCQPHATWNIAYTVHAMGR